MACSAEATRALYADWQARAAALDEVAIAEAITLKPDQTTAMPGRPARPSLVSATKVPNRSPFTPEGRAAAERCYRSVLKVDPRNGDALYLLGALLGEMSVLLDQPHTATVRAAACCWWPNCAAPMKARAMLSG